MKTVEDGVKEFFEQARAFREGKRKKYPDLIAKPLFVVPSRDQKYREQVDREMQQRLNTLFLTYLIDPNHPPSWELLARALAEKHVPGMQKTGALPGRRGRKPTRDAEFMTDLWTSMDAARARCARARDVPPHKVRVDDVVENLVRDKEFLERWPNADGTLLSKDTLKRRYHQAKKLLAEAREEDPLYQLVEGLGILLKPPEK